MEFKIDKNIEIPSPSPGRKSKYPWRKMEIGDSFLFHKEYTRLNMTCAYSAANNFRIKSRDCKKWKFAVRKSGEVGIRIWRIK